MGEENQETISGTDNIMQNAQQDNVQPKKQKKKNFLLAGMIGVFAVAGIVSILTAPKTIDMNKYLDVSYEGYNGYGSATVDVNWDKFEEDYSGKLKYSSSTKKNLNDKAGNLVNFDNVEDVLDPVEVIEASVNAKIEGDNNGNLSNGDKLTIGWDTERSVLSNIKVKLKTDDKTFKVNGLEKAKTVDIFKDINVSFEGTDGNGVVKLIFSDKDLSLYITNAAFDKSEGLSNGDKVTLKINDDKANQLARVGKLPKKSSKTYTVEGLTKYASATTDLSEETLSKLKAQAEDILTEKIANSANNYFSLGAPEYVDDYVLSKKDSSNTDLWQSAHNYVGLIYKVTVTGTRDEDIVPAWNNAGLTQDIYMNVQFTNLTVNSDGNTDVNIVDIGNCEYVNSSSDLMHSTLPGYLSIEDAKIGIVDSNASKYTANWNING